LILGSRKIAVRTRSTDQVHPLPCKRDCFLNIGHRESRRAKLGFDTSGILLPSGPLPAGNLDQERHILRKGRRKRRDHSPLAMTRKSDRALASFLPAAQESNSRQSLVRTVSERLLEIVACGSSDAWPVPSEAGETRSRELLPERCPHSAVIA